MTDIQSIVRDLAGLTIAFEHGDAVKMYMQIPHYAMSRRSLNLTHLHNRMVKAYAIGHIHVRNTGWDYNGVEIMSCGTLQDDSNLGWDMGLLPSLQFLFFGISKGRISFRYPIWTD